MKNIPAVLAFAAAALVGVSSLSAQVPASTPAPAAPGSALPVPRVRTSPHETVGLVVDGARVTVVYGRPYSKDPKTSEVRKIWGGLVPFGKVWRTGSDEATLLVLQKPIELGGAAIPAGAYTLWLLPAEDGAAKLIVNKEVGQWGVDRNGAARNAEFDLAQVDLTRETLEQPVDQFTIALAKGASGGGALMLAWEKTKYSVPFTVKK